MGKYLCEHPLIAKMSFTGSSKTNRVERFRCSSLRFRVSSRSGQKDHGDVRLDSEEIIVGVGWQRSVHCFRFCGYSTGSLRRHGFEISRLRSDVRLCQSNSRPRGTQRPSSILQKSFFREFTTNSSRNSRRKRRNKLSAMGWTRKRFSDR